ncbi:hypothetical protein I4U23_016765 [Adineta vaga]|nr:hypothetical protein I4U23_016765 [Adineta vaga]
MIFFSSSQLSSTKKASLDNEQVDTIPQLRSYTKYEKRRIPYDLGHMHIYIHKRNRHKYQRHRFPVARYDRHRMPLRGPFLNFMPWVPIFADRLTKQTIIYSPAGGVYIIPPLINIYGQLFSVAQLIASGYASLVSSGMSLNGNIDMLNYFQPQPLMGPGIPVINPLTGGFIGGMYGNFGSFPNTRNYESRTNIDYSREREKDDDDEDDYEGRESEDYNYRPLDFESYPVGFFYALCTTNLFTASEPSVPSSTTTTTTTTTTTSTTTKFSPSSGTLWQQNAITVFGDSSGTSGDDLMHLNTPIGMFYDQVNNAFIVSDYNNQRILRIPLTNPPSPGIVIARDIDTSSCGRSTLVTPVAVAMDNVGQLYVTDTTCSRLVRFPVNSNSASLGVELSASLQTPQQLSIDQRNNDIYVASYGKQVIYKFPGGNGPPIIAAGNNRVMKFPLNSVEGTPGIVVAGGNGAGSRMDQLDEPRTVLVDSGGAVYIADGNNNRVQRWVSPAGPGTTVVGGTIGAASDQLSFPESMVFDKDVHGYVPQDVWYEFPSDIQITMVAQYVDFDTSIQKINVHLRSRFTISMKMPGLKLVVGRQNPFVLLVALSQS